MRVLAGVLLFSLILTAQVQGPSAAITSLEATVKQHPDDIDSRSKLVGLYFQVLRQDASAEAARTPHILWLIRNAPEAEVLGTPAATVQSESGDYLPLKEAWLAQTAKPGAKPIVLANAANFFRSAEPERSIELLAQARAAEPGNRMWVARLGQMYAFELTGMVGMNQNGLPVKVDAQRASAKPALDAKAKLLASNDAELLGAVAASLSGQGMIAAVMSGRVAETFSLTRSLLVRAAELQPASARWPAALGESYALEAESVATPDPGRLAALAMAQFDKARAIDPASASGCTLSKYARVAVATGALEKARTAALNCLSKAQSASLPDMEIHEANIILGRVALREGDLKSAANYLLAAGRVGGSGSLSSFGPNMMLAKELLERNQREPVLDYFQLCARFWTFDARGLLNRWTSEVKAGRIPEFGANLIY